MREAPTWIKIGGAVMILAGIYIASRGKSTH
ncbi:MAG: hypothetical protein KJ606_13005 [Chloroflexi bacterium]|nr:hypothetical protein [Chloroflexota bacterium]